MILTIPHRPLANAVGYLIGWAFGIGLVTVLSVWPFTLLDVHAKKAPPVWVTVMHFALGAIMGPVPPWCWSAAAGCRSGCCR